MAALRAGYFGPEGTFTQEALLAASRGGDALELLSFPTIHDTVMAVQHGDADRALVPIENALEGSVNATLDALALDSEDVVILGEVVYPIRHCLIARTALDPVDVEVVISHPQASGQCARFLRTELPGAEVRAGSSTAESVRTVAGHDGPWAAIGTRVAAELYGCQVLAAGVEDVAGNETRFAWLGRTGDPPGGPGASGTAFKTAIVFWGIGAEAPGWLVGCLDEFAGRGVNLTRIESRPRKEGLGRYMFFVDIEGRDTDPPVADSLAGVAGRVESLRVLGSFPAA